MDEYEHVLRITRSDDSEGFVLLNVSSNGPQPLDLRVLGTEGENPFVLESEPNSSYLKRENPWLKL